MAESQSVVRVTRPEALAEQMNEDSYWLQALPGGSATSLDLRTERGRTLFVAAQQKDCADWNAWINKEIAICDVLIHPAYKVDEQTGERSPFSRVVVFTLDGQMVDFASQGVLKSLRLASLLYGLPPWPKGIVGIVTQKAVGEMKRWVQIEWKTGTSDLESPPPISPGGQPKSRK